MATTKEPTAEQIYEHIAHFTKIYNKRGDEINPMPENEKITVWCAGSMEQGFVYNTYAFDMGIESLIAKKWILQSELDELINPNPTAL